MTMCGIYRIVNKVSGRTYIGSSWQVEHRLWEHQRKLRRGTHSNPHLQASWKKYGGTAFHFEVLVGCEREKLVVLEQKFIDAYHDHGLPIYNLLPSALSGAGFSISASTREKISRSLRGRINGPPSVETRTKISQALMGHRFSDATIQKMSQAKQGRTLSLGTREKLRVARLGYRVSAQTREKMCAAQAGKTRSPETRKKLSLAHKGIRPSVETRTKMSAARKGVRLSLETRARMKEGWVVRRSNMLTRELQNG